MKKDIINCFNLKGLILDRLESNENICLHVRSPRNAFPCPKCGRKTKTVHDAKKRKIIHSVFEDLIDTGLRRVPRNAIIRNFSDFDIRNDIGAMWENFIVSEMYKRHTYDKKPFTMYHWRTYDQKEIDIIMEENGVLSAYECKYSGDSNDINKSTLNLWSALYPNAKIDVINKNNFVSYLK